MRVYDGFLAYLTQCFSLEFCMMIWIFVLEVCELCRNFDYISLSFESRAAFVIIPAFLPEGRATGRRGSKTISEKSGASERDRGVSGRSVVRPWKRPRSCAKSAGNWRGTKGSSAQVNERWVHQKCPIKVFSSWPTTTLYSSSTTFNRLTY